MDLDRRGKVLLPAESSRGIGRQSMPYCSQRTTFASPAVIRQASLSLNDLSQTGEVLVIGDGISQSAAIASSLSTIIARWATLDVPVVHLGSGAGKTALGIK